jgi:hypothetical protein
VHRAVAVVAALAVAVSLPACHHGKPAQGATGADVGTGVSTGDDTTSTAGRSGTTLGAGTPTTSGSRGTGTTSPAQRTTTTAASGNQPADTGAKDGVGAYARTLLRPSPATSIAIEVFEQSGAEPVQATLDHAVSVWHAVSAKPVSAAGPVAVGGAAQSWTADDLRNLADSQTRTPQTAGRAVVHVLFLHGTYQGDSSILGISVRGDTAAVFEDQVRAAATPGVAPKAKIEDAVTEHELGHILGLVDLVLHTGRGDPQHPGHSTDKNSVMYWAIESDLVSQVLGGPPPVDFDDADRADLTTIRNGG